MAPRVTVGLDVHYVSYGTPHGEFVSQCRAAKVTEITGEAVSLVIFNPTGIFLNQHLLYSPERAAGTWHFDGTDCQE